MPAFLGPVLGGTLLIGGRVSVLGAFLGSALVTMLTNGLLQSAHRGVLDPGGSGVVLLIAVLLDLARRSFLGQRASLMNAHSRAVFTPTGPALSSLSSSEGARSASAIRRFSRRSISRFSSSRSPPTP